MKRATYLCLALLLVPVGQAELENPSEPTPTALYFHIWDTFNLFVVNVEPTNASFFDVGGVGLPSHPSQSWDFNTIYGYATAGPVEYDFIEAGRPRLHPERGIAADVQLDQNTDPVAHLFIDARGFDGSEGTPAFVPGMTFRVTMREGDEPGSDFDAGAEIMSGDTTVTLFDARTCVSKVAGVAPLNVPCPDEIRFDPYAVDPDPYASFPQEDAEGNAILYPDANNVIALEIPLTAVSDIIPKEAAYNIRLDWYQENAACDVDECAQGNIRLVLSEEYLPRIEMAVTNPVYFEFLHPQVAAGTLLIHSGMNSPWGTYDLDMDTIDIEITGPSTPQDLQQVVAANKHVHGLHDKAAEVTYLWDFRGEGAESGEYDIRMCVQNLHHTAEACATAGFAIEGTEAYGIADTGDIVAESELAAGEAADTPAPLALVLMALALALLRRR